MKLSSSEATDRAVFSSDEDEIVEFRKSQKIDLTLNIAACGTGVASVAARGLLVGRAGSGYNLT
jgi:hypothetical protein